MRRTFGIIFKHYTKKYIAPPLTGVVGRSDLEVIINDQTNEIELAVILYELSHLTV